MAEAEVELDDKADLSNLRERRLERQLCAKAKETTSNKLDRMTKTSFSSNGMLEYCSRADLRPNWRGLEGCGEKEALYLPLW